MQLIFDIFTFNITVGEDKCLKDSDTYFNVCRRKTIYTKPKVCTLECLPKGINFNYFATFYTSNTRNFMEVTRIFGTLKNIIMFQYSYND